MELQQTLPADTADILMLLEEEAISIDPLGHIESISDETITIDVPEEVFGESLLKRLRRITVPKIRFTLHYLGISTIVFTILLATTNWHSYSLLLSAYFNPQALTDSGNDILSMLDKSRVTVYADSVTETEEETKEEGENIKKKLGESNMTIREDRFSPKRLIPSESKIAVDLDITPYDNRIIIPKIGKNIPLVDVKLDAGFDFDHIENIFMQELEK